MFNIWDFDEQYLERVDSEETNDKSSEWSEIRGDENGFSKWRNTLWLAR